MEVRKRNGGDDDANEEGERNHCCSFEGARAD